MDSKKLFDLGVSMSKRSFFCGYCHPLSTTINPANCTCPLDCGFADCGYVGSGKPEYRGSDMERPYEDIQCERDYHDARERRAREFQEEIAEIVAETDGHEGK